MRRLLLPKRKTCGGRARKLRLLRRSLKLTNPPLGPSAGNSGGWSPDFFDDRSPRGVKFSRSFSNVKTLRADGDVKAVLGNSVLTSKTTLPFNEGNFAPISRAKPSLRDHLTL